MGRFAKNPLIGDNAFGITIPNVTTAQRPSGSNGQIIFNTTTSTYQVYNGAAWYNVSEASKEKTLTIDKFQGDGSTVVFGNGSGLDLATFDGPGASLSVTPTSASDMLVYIGCVYPVSYTHLTLPTTPYV